MASKISDLALLDLEESSLGEKPPMPKVPKYTRDNPPPPPPRRGSDYSVSTETKKFRGLSRSVSPSRRFHTAPGALGSQVVNPVIYPAHMLEWKFVGRSGYVMPVLIPFRDVGMAGKLLINVKEIKGVHLKKHREVCVEICVGDKNSKIKRHTQWAKPSFLNNVKWNTELVLPIKHSDRVLRLKVITFNSKNVIKNRNEVGKTKIPISPLLLLLHPNAEDHKDETILPRSPQEGNPSMSDLRRRSMKIGSKQFQHWFDISSGHQQVGQVLLGFRLFPDPGAKIKTYHTPVLEECDSTSSKRDHSSTQFGVALHKVMERSKYEYPEVCFHVVEYLRATGGLKAEGIFRKEGRESTIRELQKSFDEAKPVVSFNSPHDAAGLLKLFFRSLPESIIPPLHLGPFIEAEKSPNLQTKIEKFKVILAALPEANRKLLRFLMGFLYEVHSNSESNKMEAKNLATCWTPSLVFLLETKVSLRRYYDAFPYEVEFSVFAWAE